MATMTVEQARTFIAQKRTGPGRPPKDFSLQKKMALEVLRPILAAEKAAKKADRAKASAEAKAVKAAAKAEEARLKAAQATASANAVSTAPAAQPVVEVIPNDSTILQPATTVVTETVTTTPEVATSGN
jgi:uncharacterized membrane protein YqiK